MKLPGSPSVELPERGVMLRPQRHEDEPFLRQLYREARWPELAPTGWPDDIKAGFLDSQFALQMRHYTTHYADATFDIVEQEGRPVGRFYVYRGSREIRVVDITLTTAARGRGLGTLLLQTVGAEAAETGRIVSLHVEQFNSARGLYRRLGFREKSENGPYCLMEWEPGIAQQA